VTVGRRGISSISEGHARWGLEFLLDVWSHGAGRLFASCEYTVVSTTTAEAAILQSNRAIPQSISEYGTALTHVFDRLKILQNCHFAETFIGSAFTATGRPGKGSSGDFGSGLRCSNSDN
jgi:hypothetical protein